MERQEFALCFLLVIRCRRLAILTLSLLTRQRRSGAIGLAVMGLGGVGSILVGGVAIVLNGLERFSQASQLSEKLCQLVLERRLG